MAKIVILGAGLTGLSTAYHLEQNNFFDFAIFEKENEHGGLCRSVNHEGFTFDYTGHLLHCNDSSFQTLLDKLLPKQSRFTHKRNSHIFSHDRYVPYPFQMNLAGLPTHVIAECLCGFAKRNHQLSPQNFHEWVIKYFGAGIAKHFFFPYNEKLLQYNLRKIHPSWTGRFVPKTTIDDLLSGLATQGPKTVGYNHQFYYPKQNGIQTFTDSLRNKVLTKIQTNHHATNIDLKQKKIYFENGHSEKFDTLITTIPLKTFLQQLSQPSSCNVKRASNYLRCNSVLNFNLGFKLDAPINKHWIYFPEKKYSFYRAGFWHNFSSDMAPAGHGALYGELAYLPEHAKKEKVEQKLKLSIEQVSRVLGISDKIVTQKILSIPHAYVIYDHWRESYLPEIHKNLHAHSIYSIGRYGAWNYSSMQEAVLDGKKLALTLAQQFIPAKRFRKNKKDKSKRKIKREKRSETGTVVL